MSYQVAIIGSFRKYYKEILNLIKLFKNEGLYVWSPKESEICNSIEDFVVFKSDNPKYTPAEIQMITLERILRADAIYVYNPDGYLGRTTCYEIGFCLSRCKPVYYYEKPQDLPIPILENNIVEPEKFCDLINANDFVFSTELNICKEAQFAFEKIHGFKSILEKSQKNIVICGSMSFYNEMLECQKLLKEIGVNSIVPKEEDEIVQTYDETQFFEFKRKVSSAYLKKIRDKETSGVLIYNGKKHGEMNYIGANTLVELAMAFSWNRKIFLFNDIYEPLRHELLAWKCICLKGDIKEIKNFLLEDSYKIIENDYEQLSFYSNKRS